MRYTSGFWKELLFLSLTGLSLLSSTALAEDARGKFTLAREVRWGTAVLPAGDYCYSVEHHATGAVVVRSLSGGPSAIVLASSSSILDATAAPRLVLTQRGQEWVVTSMIIGAEGEELYFTPSVPAAIPQEAKRPAKVAEVSSSATP
jgi:hypothetical protein